jgi:hypothetical protein
MASRSKQQERRIAADVGGSVVPASGAFWSMKGDARSDGFLIEAKRTDKASLSIKRQIWDKIRREALLDGRVPVLALQIQDRNLAVLDWEDFLELLAAAERGLGEGQLS